MRVCGLWSTRKHLFAVLLDDDGRPRPPIKAASTRDACAALFAWLAAAALDALVLSDRSGPLVELARAMKLRVYLAPHDLIEAIRAAAGYTHRPHRDTATLLARWYLTPTLRRYLRGSTASDPHPNQIPLL